MTHWSDALPPDACADALAWAREQPSYEVAWQTCQRGDWMLWLAGWRAGLPGGNSRRPLVLAACDCAELARAHWPAGNDRPAEALRVARSWARGEGATIDEVQYAAYSADSAATYADAYATRAAVAAARATRAARAAARAADAYSADDSAYAADDAAHAAATAYSADAARLDILSRCADIVRGYYPEGPSL